MEYLLNRAHGYLIGGMFWTGVIYWSFKFIQYVFIPAFVWTWRLGV